jgi:hypothetical protein
MPRKSERQQLLESLEKAILLEEIRRSDSEYEEKLFLLSLLSNNSIPHAEKVNLVINAGNSLYYVQERTARKYVLVEAVVFHLIELEEDDFLTTLYSQVASARYLDRGSAVPRAPDRIQWLLTQLDERRFKQEARMSKRRFRELADLLRQHAVFEVKRVPQRPVELQLLVALKRFGCCGNGASIGVIARHFAISGENRATL